MADITFYDAYVPIFLKCLDAADAILDKAVQHAKDNALNVDAEYINAAIADDMFPFAKQIQTLTRVTRETFTRTTGIECADWPAEAKTFAELSATIQHLRTFIKAVRPEQLNGRQDEILVSRVSYNKEMKASFKHWYTTYSIPTVFFHLVTAYDILRKQGVPLGKMDYLTPFIAQ